MKPRGGGRGRPRRLSPTFARLLLAWCSPEPAIGSRSYAGSVQPVSTAGQLGRRTCGSVSLPEASKNRALNGESVTGTRV